MDINDKVEIENLIFCYARLVDTGNYEALGSQFTYGEITSNQNDNRLAGADAIQEHYSAVNRLYSNGSPRTHHVVTNLEFNPDADGVRVNVRSYFTVFQQTDCLALQPIATGRFNDWFHKINSAWQYQSKHIEVILLGDFSQHVNTSRNN